MNATQCHIYLIQDGHDVGTNVFKFGKSKQGINDIIKLKRFKGYSNGTIQYNTWNVSYNLVDKIESEIKIILGVATYLPHNQILINRYYRPCI